MHHFTRARTTLTTAAVVLALTAAACGSGDDGAATTVPPVDGAGVAATVAPGSTVELSGVDEPAAIVAEPPSAAYAGRDSEEVPPATGTEPLPETTTTAAPVIAEEPGPDDASVEVAEVDRQQLPSLTAGWVDDNEAWDEYLQYREWFVATGVASRNVFVDSRHIVEVITASGAPVLGAKVELTAGGQPVATALTHSSGRVLLFPPQVASAEQQQIDPVYTVMVTKDGAEQSFEIEAGTRTHRVVLDTPSTVAPVALDVHFLIDATGSMDDEIDRLKANMIAVAESIAALPAEPDVRFGMTTYRDRGDLYVTRSTDFTSDVQAFTEALSRVEAAGGGDYPESLNQGLHDAIHRSSWRVDDAVSVMILLADAPPHLDYANDASYDEEVFEAASRGIAIMPIASSGLDAQGEFVFRQLAQITDGSFVFLTYGADGGPGGSTTHHVDDYSVLPLDELIVQLVADELAPLSPDRQP